MFGITKQSSVCLPGSILDLSMTQVMGRLRLRDFFCLFLFEGETMLVRIVVHPMIEITCSPEGLIP
jgi:hypothetical protein